MNESHWTTVDRVLDAALGKPPAEREAFLRQICGSNDALRLEIEGLLAHERATHGFLDVPPLAILGDSDGSSEISAIGRQLGPYRILALLGEGGMGAVYKARDTRLERTVAIKILHHKQQDDREFAQRFEREAMAVAALRHPHICVLHDIRSDDGIEYLVMEYLDGETLAQRIARGPLPLPDVLRFAIEIASALTETHRSAIVHRDIKPGNIMLAADGAKLLDFGIAKRQTDRWVQIPPGASASPLRSVLRGTPHYMSPEQVEGTLVDGRTDIFAFGAVLYEAITGRTAFAGDTIADLRTAILERHPEPIQTHGSAALESLDRVIRRCLQKDPAERWPLAEEMLLELRRISGNATAPIRVRAPRARLVWVAAVVVSLAAAIVLRNSSDSNTGTAPATPIGLSAPAVREAALTVGSVQQLTAAEELELDPSFHPDGTRVAYSAGRATQMRIVVREIGSNRTSTLPIVGDQSQFQPRWSPDGRELLYVTREGVFVASIAGGNSRRVDASLGGPGNYSTWNPGGTQVSGALWSPDGREIAVAYGGTMWRVYLDGRPPRQLASGASELHWCDWSPNGRWIACTAGNPHLAVFQQFGNIAPSAIVLIPAAGGAPVEIADQRAANHSPVWSADSTRLYFVSNRQGTGDIYAIEIGDDGTPRREPVRVTTGLGAYSIALSADRRRLAYSAMSARANIWSLPVPTVSYPINISDARPLTTGNQTVETMNATSDRKWLLYDSNLYGNSDLFRMPLEGGESTRLTTDPADDFAPNVSLDGQWMAFHSWRTKTRDVFVQPFEGGPAEQVTAGEGQESYPHWLPDGALVFIDQTMDSGVMRGLSTVRRDRDGTWGAPQPFHLPRSALVPSLSADGRLVYLREGAIESVALAGGRVEQIYKPAEPTAPVPGKVVIGEDGRTLYFKSHDAAGHASFWSLPITGGAARLLVRFDDLSRPSRRRDFEVAAGRFFFTIDDRRSNIWTADIIER